MTEILRKSPVFFKKTANRVEKRDNWTLSLSYEDEKDPFIADLSFKARFDVQSSSLSSIHPFGIKIPEKPGMSVFENGFLINRMNQTQASIWHLTGDSPRMPEETAYTDVTEATLFLAVVGKEVFSIAEKLTRLDFLDPEKKTPFLLQGPFSHVNAQMVVFKGNNSLPGILFTCARGYGQTMVEAVMAAGAEWDLSFAGEERFVSWVKTLE